MLPERVEQLRAKFMRSRAKRTAASANSTCSRVKRTTVRANSMRSRAEQTAAYARDKTDNCSRNFKRARAILACNRAKPLTKSTLINSQTSSSPEIETISTSFI